MNTTFEVFQFRQAKQLEGESVGQFSIRLRLLARNCGFANADEEIKNQIIFATTSSRLRRVALRQDLNLPSLLNQARLLEDVNRATTAMEGSSTTTTVQAISGQPRYGHAGTSRNAQQPRCFSSRLKYGGSAQQRTHVSPPQCFHCGAPWPHEGGQVNCPAKFASCKACGRKGHYGKVCQSAHKPIFQISHDSDSDESVYAVGTISQVSHQNLPEVHLQVNNTPITFLIDTGASVSVIGTSTLNKLGALTKLQQAGTRIYAYGSDAPLPIIGKLSVTLKYRDSDTTEDVFVIEGTVKSLLSFAAANRLGLIQITYAIQGHSQKDARSNGEVPPNLLETPLAAFPELCAGVGKLKNLQVHLHIDKAIAPVAQPHRRIPFAVRSKVEEKISQLLALDIIEGATGPTPWVSPVVIVPKPHNPEDIRLCIDMKCANRAILRERHVCPTIDDVITALNGSTLFTKLDLKDGYHQLELDNESRTITTFATHNKLYRYKRLMFGINAAAEVFQETIRQVLNGIPHVLNISDDILVFGKTKDEHDQALQATLERLTENGLTVNPKKCLFARKELCFFGHIFSASGIRTDPQKIAALKKMPAPANAHEVRSLLDHKPLVSILTNPRACPSARIERLVLRIQQYNFRVEHKCGINNPSDYLSRHPMPSSPADARLAHSTNAYVNFIAHHNIPKAMTRAEVAAATLNDPHMQKVIAALSNPARWNDPALREFISVQHELSLTDSGLLLKGNCLVLPAALQQQAICLAHIGHQGISKTKALMKRKVWFPHLDSMVQTTLKNCMACQATIQHQHSDPVAIPSKPNQPWEALSLDFAGPFPNGKYIMVLMDDTSRYPLVAALLITRKHKIYITTSLPPRSKEMNRAKRFSGAVHPSDE
ncbi:uncharacterized protein K02A2.6-like [Ixodes scapularis]|uniref:uncharacterized protein K02A2.6-like n=1 Tax=Ixodes scapularis TaxID=6945 RepID=UPI001A9DB2F4|nr:uncharacterized protein K02A2.6-like [Ixodes scapularis]